MLAIYLKDVYCREETDEVGADEPYVLVTAVDVRRIVPGFEVVLYGPFADVDAGEGHRAPGLSKPFWGLNGFAQDLGTSEHAMFVVSLIENDNGNPDALRGIVKGAVASSLSSSINEARPTRLVKLVNDIASVLRIPTAIGLNQDDVVGTTALSFSDAEIARANAGLVVERTLELNGDGGRYALTFVARSAPPVFGDIKTKWAQFGAENGPLRMPLGGESATFDGVGRSQHFEGGIVTWHPDMGVRAHVVWGLIGARWLAIGREAFGYPITDELTAPDGVGKYNHFRAMQLPGTPEASIYWSPQSGAHEVYGAIRVKWAEMGWERSSLGYPTSAEFERDGGRLQRFERGSLFWTPDQGVVVRSR